MIKKFFLLPGNSKYFSVIIICLNLYYRIISVIIPFRYRSRFVGEKNTVPQLNNNNHDKKYVSTITKVVNRLNKQFPLKFNCMIQAQTVAFLLRRKKIPYVFYLGVKKNKNILKAHAWVKYDSLTISGGQTKNYNVVSYFGYSGH